MTVFWILHHQEMSLQNFIILAYICSLLISLSTIDMADSKAAMIMIVDSTYQSISTLLLGSYGYKNTYMNIKHKLNIANQRQVTAIDKD